MHPFELQRLHPPQPLPAAAPSDRTSCRSAAPALPAATPAGRGYGHWNSIFSIAQQGCLSVRTSRHCAGLALTSSLAVTASV